VGIPHGENTHTSVFRRRVRSLSAAFAEGCGDGASFREKNAEKCRGIRGYRSRGASLKGAFAVAPGAKYTS
jgi:hypothetical protein